MERKRSFAAAAVMIAAAVALCAGMEFVLQAGEAAVAAEIDRMGPALRLIPAGRTSVDLARFELGSRLFTANESARLRLELSPWVRELEGRLLLRKQVGGLDVPVAGIDPSKTVSAFEALGRLGRSDAALGAGLAERLGKKKGDAVMLDGRRFHVAAVLPETAGPQEQTLFLPLKSLRKIAGLPDALNELRVFFLPGAPIDRVISYLNRNHPELNVIGADGGDTTAPGMLRGLGQHRRLVYLISAAVAALIIFIWSYLNAEERRLEMATLSAIGASWAALLALQLLRAAMAGFLGALAGCAAGAAMALAQDFDLASSVVWSGKTLLAALAGAVGVSLLGALPASIMSAAREHMTVLQQEA